MTNNKKQIEIELRALLTREEYTRVKKFLAERAIDLGKDDKDVYFFLLPNKIVKVVNNVSQKTAKIVIKFNRLGRGRSDFEEIEIPINPKDFEKAVKLFSALPFEQIQNSYQKRHNYRYNGVEIALKYSETWGFHMELEIIIDNLAKKDKAERKIRKVAQELGVKILTEEELAKFAKRIDQEYKNNSLENKNIIPPSAFNEYLVQDDKTGVETTTMGVPEQ